MVHLMLGAALLGCRLWLLAGMVRSCECPTGDNTGANTGAVASPSEMLRADPWVGILSRAVTCHRAASSMLFGFL